MSKFMLVETKVIKSQNISVKVYEDSQYKCKAYCISPPEVVRESSFCVAFRTPLNNSSGVQHIIEHSVLCGSKRYPVKEPFQLLLSNSLNTYLNAFTAQNYTAYPVASASLKDIENLMRVYMDGVFRPRLLEDERIFGQEGYHLEYDELSQQLKPSGIVLNEMKGAYSDPMQYLQQTCTNSLLKDSPLGYDSGGHPDEIIKLQYQEVIQFHKKYYTATNCQFYIVSQHDPQFFLNIIEEELQGANTGDIIMTDFSNINSEEEKAVQYSASSQEELYHMCRGCLGKNIIQQSPLEDYLLQITDYLLHRSPASPIKKVLLESGLLEDFSSDLQDDAGYIHTIQTFNNFKIENKNKILQLLELQYNSMINQQQYLSETLVKQCINHLLIEMKEIESDYGVNLSSSFMKYTLFTDDIDFATKHQDFEPILIQIQEMEWSQLQELLINVIKHYFLNAQTIVTMEPIEDLNSKITQQSQIYWQNAKQNMQPNEIQSIIDYQQKIQLRQKQQDSHEDISKIPQLDLKDLSYNIIQPTENLKFTKVNKNFFFYNTHNDIIIFQLTFQLNDLTDKQQLFNYSMLCEILTEIKTSSHTLQQLSGLISDSTAGFDFEIKGYNNSIVLNINFKCLQHKATDACQLLMHILQHTEINTNQYTKIKTLLKQVKQVIKQNLDGDGIHDAISGLSIGQFRKEGQIIDVCEGFQALKNLEQLFQINSNYEECEEEDEEENTNTKTYDKKLVQIIEQLKELNTKLLITPVIVFVGCDQSQINIIEKCYEIFKQQLQLTTILNESSNNFITFTDNKIIEIQQNVNYISKAIEISDITPELMLTQQLMSNKYLWDNVRVLGGAYGCQMNIQLNKVVQIISYRDPNYEKTINIINNITDFLDQLEMDQLHFEQLKIGAVGSRQPPSSTKIQFNKAFDYFMYGIDSLQQTKNIWKIKDLTLQEIKSCSAILQKIKQADVVAAIAKK